MSTLVTGGTGFVGINLVRDLAAAGHEVVSIDVAVPDPFAEAFLSPWAERVTWVTGELLDPTLLEHVGRDHAIELIVHAAAYTPYEDEETTHFRHTMDNNVGGLLNLVDFVKAHDVRRLLAVSTLGVYTPEYFTEPDGHVVIREDQPVDPHHVYGISKIASESLLRRAAALFGFEALSVRLAQNWGPMERVTPYHSRMSIPWYWARQAARGETIVASPHGFGTTNGRRLNQDHPYVYDTAAAVRALLEAPVLSYGLYNVSAGEPVFVDDMVAAMAQAAPEAEITVEQADSAAVSPGITLDSSRLIADTGFTPAYDMAAALRHCIEWRLETGFLEG
jgi:UDP-glucose 4-epimerase